MVAVVSVSILFHMPRYLNFHVVKRSDGSLMVTRSYLGTHGTYQLIYGFVINFILIYAIPIFLLVVMTYRHLIFTFPSFFKPRLPISRSVNVESFHGFNSTQSPLWQITFLIYFAFTSFVEPLSCARSCFNAQFLPPGALAHPPQLLLILVQSNCNLDLCLVFF